MQHLVKAMMMAMLVWTLHNNKLENHCFREHTCGSYMNHNVAPHSFSPRRAQCAFSFIVFLCPIISRFLINSVLCSAYLRYVHCIKG